MGGMAAARWRPHVFGARLCQLVVVELVRAQLHLSARLAALEDVIVRLGIQLAPLQHVVHGMGHGMGRGIAHCRVHVASASSSPRVHPMVPHIGLGAHLGLVLDREALRLCDEGKLVACGQGGWGDMVRDGGVSTPAAKAEAVVVETVATTQAAVKRSGGRG